MKQIYLKKDDSFLSMDEIQKGVEYNLVNLKGAQIKVFPYDVWAVAYPISDDDMDTKYLFVNEVKELKDRVQKSYIYNNADTNEVWDLLDKIDCAIDMLENKVVDYVEFVTKYNEED